MKLNKQDVQVLRELEGAPDHELRRASLQSCATYIGIHPRMMKMVVGRLLKAGMVEERVPWGSDMPQWIKLTSVGERALSAVE